MLYTILSCMRHMLCIPRASHRPYRWVWYKFMSRVKSSRQLFPIFYLRALLCFDDKRIAPHCWIIALPYFVSASDAFSNTTPNMIVFRWYCVRRDDWKDCWARFLFDALHCVYLHPTGLSIGQQANVNVRQRNRFFISLTTANTKFNVAWFFVRAQNSTIWRVKMIKKRIKLRHDLCKEGFKRKIISTFVRCY